MFAAAQLQVLTPAGVVLDVVDGAYADAESAQDDAGSTISDMRDITHDVGHDVVQRIADIRDDWCGLGS